MSHGRTSPPGWSSPIFWCSGPEPGDLDLARLERSSTYIRDVVVTGHLWRKKSPIWRVDVCKGKLGEVPAMVV